MATDVVVCVVPGGLMAANAVEAEKLEQFRGKEMMVRISVPRNLAFHKKFMALIGVAFDMADHALDREAFRAYVTAGAGWCHWIAGADGNLVAVPKSVSFAAMDESEFQRLYSDVAGFICRTWVVDEEQLYRVLDFL